MKVIVNVLVKKGNKLLMVKEATGKDAGKWNFPAGHLNENENIFDGAIREAKEETGFDVKLLNIVDIQNLVMENKHVILFMFAAEIIGGEISFDKSEILDVDFIEIDNLLKMTDCEIRSAVPRQQSIKNLIENKVYSLDIIKNFDLRN